MSPAGLKLTFGLRTRRRYAPTPILTIDDAADLTPEVGGFVIPLRTDQEQTDHD